MSEVRGQKVALYSNETTTGGATTSSIRALREKLRYNWLDIRTGIHCITVSV